jgi:hypothetical protein
MAKLDRRRPYGVEERVFSQVTEEFCEWRLRLSFKKEKQRTAALENLRKNARAGWEFRPTDFSEK